MPEINARVPICASEFGIKFSLVNCAPAVHFVLKFNRQPTMKLSIFLAVLITALSRVCLAADGSNTGVIQIDNEKVAAMFAKGGTLLQTNNFKVMAGRRVAPGEVEI